MKYKTKSIIIGRKPRLDENDYSNRPCFVSFFDVNNPHKVNVAPKKMIDFLKANRVIVRGAEVNFLLMGGDVLVNDLEYVDITEKQGNIFIVAKLGKK